MLGLKACTTTAQPSLNSGSLESWWILQWILTHHTEPVGFSLCGAGDLYTGHETCKANARDWAAALVSFHSVTGLLLLLGVQTEDDLEELVSTFSMQILDVLLKEAVL